MEVDFAKTAFFHCKYIIARNASCKTVNIHVKSCENVGGEITKENMGP